MICTWNNCQLLGSALTALAKCDIPEGLEWEVVVVNNNSTDSTEEVVHSFTRLLPIAYVYERRQGLSWARNAGLARASGRLAVFTDDDVKPCEGWIASYWSAFQEKPSGFYFGGPIISEFEGTAPDEALLRFAPFSVKGLHWGDAPKILGNGECFIGVNWACPLEAVRALGGFNVHMGLNPSSGKVRVGEETYLMKQLSLRGFSPWYVPGAWVRHNVPARKCTLKHIAERAEAGAAYLALADPPRLDSTPTLGGVPRWMYRRAVELWLRWLKTRLSGQKAYEEYVEFRSMLGTMRGIRELWSAGRLPPRGRRHGMQ